MADIICDFCSDPHPTWRYPCMSFVMDDITARSVADWAACDECHRLIESGVRSAVTKRSVDTMQSKYIRLIGRVEMERWMTALHRRFFDNRTGPAVRINKVQQTP